MKLIPLLHWIVCGSALLAATPTVIANPFERTQKITLGDMEFDGDLNFRIAIGTIGTLAGTRINIRLEHRMENLGYGEVQSVFILRPLVTSVGVKAGVFYWEAPSGEEYRFPLESRVQRRLLDADTKIEEIARNVDYGFYERFGVRVFYGPEFYQCLIQSGGFEWLYLNGSLVKIRTPWNEEFRVNATGKFITEISDGNGLRVQADWTDGVPTRIRPQEGIEFLFENALGQIKKMTRRGGQSVELAYNSDGLISELSQNNMFAKKFSWEPIDEHSRGDNLYPKPFFIKRVDGCVYGYFVGDNKIVLSRTEDRVTKRLILNTEGGSVKIVPTRSFAK